MSSVKTNGEHTRDVCSKPESITISLAASMRRNLRGFIPTESKSSKGKGQESPMSFMNGLLDTYGPPSTDEVRESFMDGVLKSLLGVVKSLFGVVTAMQAAGRTPLLFTSSAKFMLFDVEFILKL